MDRVVDLERRLEEMDRGPSGRKLVAMLLLLAIKDGSSELTIEPWSIEPDGVYLRMFSRVGEEVEELPQAPPHMTKPSIRELKAVAGHLTPRRRILDWLNRLAGRPDPLDSSESRSRFRVMLGQEWVDISSTVISMALGDRIVLRFGEQSPGLPEKGRAVAQAWHVKWMSAGADSTGEST